MSDASSSRSSRTRRRKYRYRNRPNPVAFPTDIGLNETRRHYELRTALFQLVKLALADRASIGSEQYIYWNGADPTRRLAPDLFVRLGVPDRLFESWKTWERGAPEVAVEILMDSDSTELAWDDRLRGYHELGIEELVRFDPVAPADTLRIWDRVDGDLVERQLDEPLLAESAVLRMTWVVTQDAVLGRVLRLARNAEGTDLLPTPVEHEARLRAVAERRVEELEAELRKRGT